MIRKYWRFFIVVLFLLCSLFILEHTKILTPKAAYPEMLDAARRTEAAFAAIKEEKLARGYKISPVDDINQTGMIGESYTEITTTLGSLEAKRSSVNPNTAAMIVDMLTDCGVKEGDTVAVNLSSSFPGLNLAVICSLDAIGANGIIINSVGASTYGANLPDFTYLDMEHVLLQKGLIENHSRFFSLGGADDIGREMPEEIKEKIVERISDYGLTFLYYEDLEKNLAARMSIYEAEDTPVCLINVGGNLLSFGGGTEMTASENGILRPGPAPGLFSGISLFSDSKFPGAGSQFLAAGSKSPTGLIPEFLGQGVPVVHLLNMKSLLPAHGLPYDPSPMPAAGEGDVYLNWQYNKALAALSLAAALLLLGWAVYNYPHRKYPL